MLLVGEVARRTLEHELEIALDRSQRRTQLVGDGGDELVLETVELAQALRRLDEAAFTGHGRFLSLHEADHPQQNKPEKDDRTAGDHDPVARLRRPQEAGDRRDERRRRQDQEPGPGEAHRSLRRFNCNSHRWVERRSTEDQVEEDPASVEEAAGPIAAVQELPPVDAVGREEDEDRRDDHVRGAGCGCRRRRRAGRQR